MVSARSRFRPFYWDFSTCRFPKWQMCDSCYKSSLHRQNASLSDIDNCDRYSTGITSLKKSECCIGGMDFVTLGLRYYLINIKIHLIMYDIGSSFHEIVYVTQYVTFNDLFLWCVLKYVCRIMLIDPGLYDMTMLRFEVDQKVGFREYKRSDGTRSYFFSLDIARDLFIGAGFIEAELE
ncbi:putative tRNA(Thr) (cytosine(32)-N(3))-methyltransferase [Helianthus anomalus]